VFDGFAGAPELEGIRRRLPARSDARAGRATRHPTALVILVWIFVAMVLLAALQGKGRRAAVAITRRRAQRGRVHRWRQLPGA
jgi:hypothetical protein